MKSGAINAELYCQYYKQWHRNKPDHNIITTVKHRHKINLKLQLCNLAHR